MAGHEALLNL